LTGASTPNHFETEAAPSALEAKESAARISPANKLAWSLVGILVCALTFLVLFYQTRRQPHPQQAEFPAQTMSQVNSPPATTVPSPVIDLNPPRVSLLNPPVVDRSPAAARDPRMATGRIKFRWDTSG